MNRLTIAHLLLISLFSISPFFVGITTSQYDPYADYDSDGDVDIFDIVATANAYGTTGNPTRNVTVTNWPQIQQVNLTSTQPEVVVWWNQYWTGGDWSPDYKSYGFGQLHVLAYITGLTGGEILAIKVHGKLHQPDFTFGVPVEAYSIVLDSTVYSTAFTIPVPGETFNFFISTGGSGDCYVHLSYYLTWAQL